MSDTNPTTYNEVAAAYDEHLGNLRIGHFEIWADVIKFDVVDEFGTQIEIMSFPLSEAPDEVLSPYYDFYRSMIAYTAGGLQQSAMKAMLLLDKIAENLPDIVRIEEINLFDQDEPVL